ncbi:MAG: hypothetical protein KDC79_06930 [Cyclobacteriaceae bacterium]|nr:hypothetical protein [Cyclobacteriaceae bacterium]
MKTKLSILGILICSVCYGQHHEYVYRNSSDSSFNCYLKLFPKTDTIRGLIIRDYSKLFDAKEKSPYEFTELALEAGMMILITNTSNQFPELFISDSTIKLLDEMVQEVVSDHRIPEDNIFMGGISSSGTRALRYAQYCAQGKSKTKIRGVFVVDSPLDLERLYNSALHHKKNFTDGMLWEANLILPMFKSIYGGSPKEHYDAYRNSSVFSHTDSLGGNAVFLKNTEIIIFHEPDIDWWIKERGCSYYDINSYDLAAFTVFMKNLGNQTIELITTSGMGFDREGKRKPHSWTIVDEHYLLDWILKRIR